MVLRERLPAFLNEKQNMLLNFILYESQNTYRKNLFLWLHCYCSLYIGIPDSLFGTAWPAIYTEFDLPISFGSFVTVIISCGTIVSSMFSAKFINRFGTNKVSAFSTALTAVALLGFSVSWNLWLLCIFAVPLGLGAGAIDTALNNYVAVHYSATHMCFLHCFYGIGVSVSPYIMSLVIGGKSGWRGGYQVAFLIQLCIALLLVFTLPIWEKKFTLKYPSPFSFVMPGIRRL